MMSSDEIKLVGEVYRKLFDGEESATGWDDVDTQMEYLDYLDDDQLVREAAALMIAHSRGQIRCANEFCNDGCSASNVVDAAKAILSLYEKTGNLHVKNRYVLAQYLSLSQIGNIVSIIK